MVALGGYEVYLKNRSQTCQGAEIFAFSTFDTVYKRWDIGTNKFKNNKFNPVSYKI